MTFTGSGLKEIIIPNSVTEIEDSAFEFCNNLENVKLSVNLQSIGSKAFANCSLKFITIPYSVESIGVDAFRCKTIRKVIIENPNIKLPENETVFFDGYNKPSICSYEYSKSLEDFCMFYGYKYKVIS